MIGGWRVFIAVKDMHGSIWAFNAFGYNETTARMCFSQIPVSDAVPEIDLYDDNNNRVDSHKLVSDR